MGNMHATRDLLSYDGEGSQSAGRLTGLDVPPPCEHKAYSFRYFYGSQERLELSSNSALSNSTLPAGASLGSDVPDISTMFLPRTSAFWALSSCFLSVCPSAADSCGCAPFQSTRGSPLWLALSSILLRFLRRTHAHVARLVSSTTKGIPSPRPRPRPNLNAWLSVRLVDASDVGMLVGVSLADDDVVVAGSCLISNKLLFE